MQRKLDSGSETGNHALTIKGNNLGAGIWKVLRQESAPEAKAVIGIGNGQIDFLDVNLQCVARLCLLHVNRAVQDVSPGAMAGDGFVYVTQILLYLNGSNPGLFKPRRTVGDQSLEGHDVAGVDAEGGSCRRIVVSPGDGLRSRGEGVCVMGL